MHKLRNIRDHQGDASEVFTRPSGNTHYSFALTPKELNTWAKMAARMLEEDFPSSVPVLVYRGMSGIAAATAVSMHLKMEFEMIYVRKPNETSHGGRVEHGPFQWQRDILDRVYVFVDDFMSSGESFKHVVDATANMREDQPWICIMQEPGDGLSSWCDGEWEFDKKRSLWLPEGLNWETDIYLP